MTPAARGPGSADRPAGADLARLQEVYRQILARAPEHDLVPTLDRITAVLELLGDPQNSYPAVHLTGTNGKTSTTRLVERLLREHGLRTGRFTSPHLSDVRERITVDGALLSPERFIEVYDEVLPAIGIVDARSQADDPPGPPLTFFEVLVAMAFAAFADAPVDAAVVEVGMGGSWDATNAIEARVAVILPIAVDHQHFLGSTIAEIATEKAGIIKPGSVVVLAEQPSEVATRIVHERAAEVGATVIQVGERVEVLTREVAVGGQLLTLRGLAGDYEDVFLPLHGEYQAQNALAALTAVEAFMGGAEPKGRLEPDVVRQAFADASSPGRLEVVRRSPTILVDAAHNPAGAQALADALENSFNFTRLVGVVAVLADKDALGILEALQPVLDEVVITASSSGRAMDPDDLGELAEEVFGSERVQVVYRLDEALDVAAGLAESVEAPGAAVLATGSITLAGEVRVLLRAGLPDESVPIT